MSEAESMAGGARGSGFEESNDDERRRILLRGGTVLTMDRLLGDFARGDVLIEGNKIAAVGPDLSHAAADGQAVVFAADGMVVMPGLHDTHRHFWQTQLRRLMSGFTLDEYIAVALGQIAPHYRPEDIYVGTLIGGLGAIDSGVTTVLDFSHNSRSRAHADAAVAGLRDTGIRAIFTCAPPLFGTWEEQWPGDLERLKAAEFSSTEQLLTLRSGLLGSPEIGGGFYAVSPQSLALARELDVAVSADGVFGPAAAANIEELGRAGLLGPDITLIHCTDLTDEAWRMIADAGVTVSLCPTSDAQIGIFGGLPPIQRALDYGIQPALSVDVECVLSSDMFTQMQSIYTTQRMFAYNRRYNGDADAPAPIGIRAILEMATIQGAFANGLLDKVGTLTPGKEADIVLLGAEDINTMPLNNAAATVVLGADTKNVDTVFIAGRLMKSRGSLLHQDIGAIRRLVSDSRDYLMEAAGYALDVVGHRPFEPTTPSS
jgi:cytosine/adenosine deaminase-related metal-dependent hydrolase